jgi:hypothetical protein
MQIRWLLLPISLLILCAGCQTALIQTAPTQTPVQGELQPMSTAVIQTTIGDLSMDSTRFVQEINGAKAEKGQTILLIAFKRMDGKKLTLEDFHSARSQVEAGLLAADGTPYVCTMGGYLDGETVMGCIIPDSLDPLKFFWGDNPKVELDRPKG